ncbi:hypothetical protein MK786_10140 [Microbacterium sp. CFH 31415]|uniref:hypothetical protein n=1 Tax=Microbacterium sp. CFH 31415 TaxID=2921732 RepID=UPI001F13E3BA|nr:hypothetical protein [Microbacterium sp. CFH 31415]MCH6231096.1 hypothetical protein [Microbacterium sp. CFH 31415]
MLSLVTAAEQQYRHETEWRDRELALLRAIRARREAQAAALTAPEVAPAPAAPARPRGVWARPIGVHAAAADACPTACAIA